MQIEPGFPLSIVSELGINKSLMRQDVKPVTRADPEILVRVERQEFVQLAHNSCEIWVIMDLLQVLPVQSAKDHQCPRALNLLRAVLRPQLIVLYMPVGSRAMGILAARRKMPPATPHRSKGVLPEQPKG